MKISYCLAVLFSLKLFSCAEVTSKQEKSKLCGSLTIMPSDVMHKIGSYLDNPFSDMIYVSHHFHDIFLTFPIKGIIQERFNIPELATDDVDNYEHVRIF